MNLLEFFQELIETGEVSIEGYDDYFFFMDGQLYLNIDGVDYLLTVESFARIFNISYLRDITVHVDYEQLN